MRCTWLLNALWLSSVGTVCWLKHPVYSCKTVMITDKTSEVGRWDQSHLIKKKNINSNHIRSLKLNQQFHSSLNYTVIVKFVLYIVCIVCIIGNTVTAGHSGVSLGFEQLYILFLLLTKFMGNNLFSPSPSSLFGIDNNIKTDSVFDFISLLAKQYLYKCNMENNRPNINIFRRKLIVSRYKIEEYNAVINCSCPIFCCHVATL